MSCLSLTNLSRAGTGRGSYVLELPASAGREAIQSVPEHDVWQSRFGALPSSAFKFSQIKEVPYYIGKVFEYLNNSLYFVSMVDYHLKRIINAGVMPSYISLQTDKLGPAALDLVRLADSDKA